MLFKGKEDGWKGMSYHIFDTPSFPEEPYQKRYEKLMRFFQEKGPFVDTKATFSLLLFASLVVLLIIL